MDQTLNVKPIGSFETRLRPPGSKSLTNRALLLAALAEGQSVLHEPLIADDTQQMLTALGVLGFTVVHDEEKSLIRVTGSGGGIPNTAENVNLFLGNAGTAYRFLTSACCLGISGPRQAGVYHLDGVERMRQRPIEQLVDALQKIGGVAGYQGQAGYPPLRIRGTGLRGGVLEMSPTVSSQYISSLLIVGPYCEHGLTLRFRGPVTSRPYVEMTMGLMRHFGAEVQADPKFTTIRVMPGVYRAIEYEVEPDASSASYFLAAAAIVPGSKCTIEGLSKSSLQGDVGFADVLHTMGAGLTYGEDTITVSAPPMNQGLHGIDVDLNKMPDMAQTLAAVALFAKGKTTIRNVGNLRVKETDRLEAVATELKKFGAQVEIDGDDLTIVPPADGHVSVNPGKQIDTYDDHRMAMSFAVIGLMTEGVVIRDPGCVSKTFPQYFDYLAGLDKASYTPPG